MKVQIFRDDGLVTLRFEPAVYVSAGYGTSVILTDEEYALLEQAQEQAKRDKDGEEAAATGDANTPFDEEDCPICGGPLPCVKCLADLRCDA